MRRSQSRKERHKENSRKTLRKKLTSVIMVLIFAILLYIPIFQARAASNDEPIKILEIEPGNKFMINSGSSDEGIGECNTIPGKSIKGLVGTRDVKITHVTMPEFISQVDQINGKYDIVVIGRKNDGLRTSSKSGTSVYRDYSNPLSESETYIPEGWYNDNNKKTAVKNGESFNGTKYEEYYSENDITNKRSKEILELIDSNQTVIIDRNIMDGTLNDTKDGTLNDTKDGTLNDTKLVANFKAKTSFQMDHNMINLDNVLEKYVSSINKRLNLSITTQPISDDQINIVNGKKPSGIKKNRILTVGYTIENQTNTTQKVDANLYLDVNGDSMYIGNEATPYTTNSNIEIAANSKISGTIKYTVPDGFLGYLDWKLEIVNNETKVKSYKTGTVIYNKLASEDDKVIKVLQITCPPGDTSSRYGDNTDLNNNISLKNNTRIQELFNSSNLTGYKIVVDEQNMDKFNDNTKKWKESSKYKNETDANYLNEYLNGKYNMIIIGFADAYGLNSKGSHEFNASSINAIKTFIKTGQSVMFTHDTIPITVIDSYSETDTGAKNDKTAYLGSKRLAQAFRDSIGQARYVDEYNKNQDDITKPKYDDSGKITGYSAISHDTNKQYTSYGYTDSIIRQAGEFGWNKDNKQPYLSIANKASKMNQGVINEFPFKLGQVITATTHTQWFQLNLEDPDVVPWYTIDADVKSDGDSWRNAQLDKYDARNNYYTYSKGNITYSGSGHRNDFGGNADSELQLFVNTIIKAERGANHAPTIDCSIPRENTNETPEDTTKDVINEVIAANDYIFTVDANDLDQDAVNMYIKLDNMYVTVDNLVDLKATDIKTDKDNNKFFKIDTKDNNRNKIKIKIPASKLPVGNTVNVGLQAIDVKGAKSIKNYKLKAIEAPNLELKANLTGLNKVNAENQDIADSEVISDTISVRSNEKVKAKYDIVPKSINYGNASDYFAKRVAILFDASITGNTKAAIGNGIDNTMFSNNNFVNNAANDVQFDFISYGEKVKSETVDPTAVDYNGTKINYQTALHNKLLNTEESISNSKKLGEALIKAKDFLNEDGGVSGKTIIMISSGNYTDDIEKSIYQLKGSNFNVITLFVDNGNLSDKLKKLHKDLGGISSDYYVSKPNDSHNDIQNSIMQKIADSLKLMRYKTFLLSDVKLNFNLGSDIDLIEDGTMKDYVYDENKKYEQKISDVKFMATKNQDGSLKYKGYFCEDDESEQTTTNQQYSMNFKIKANENAVGPTCKFINPNEVTYDSIGIKGKTNIEKTPILELIKVELEHGVYKKIEAGKATLDETGALAFAKKSVVTFGVNIKGMDSNTDLSVKICDDAIFSKEPIAYKVKSNGNLEKLGEFIPDLYDIKKFNFKDFDGEHNNNIVVLYSIKLNDSSTIQTLYTNTIIADGTTELAKVNSRAGSNNYNDTNEGLPDLF